MHKSEQIETNAPIHKRANLRKENVGIGWKEKMSIPQFDFDFSNTTNWNANIRINVLFVQTERRRCTVLMHTHTHIVHTKYEYLIDVYGITW